MGWDGMRHQMDEIQRNLVGDRHMVTLGKPHNQYQHVVLLQVSPRFIPRGDIH